MSILESDPRARQIVEILRAAGIVPRKFGESRRDYSNFYSLSRYREYEDSDFEGLELLQVWPETVADSEYAGSTHYVRRARLQKGVQFARSLHGDIIMVPERIRLALQSAEFRGLDVAPLRVMKNTPNPDDDPTREADTSKIGGPWWTIEPLITLPPVSPYLSKVRGKDGGPGPRDAKWLVIREPGFDDVEFHFLRSELRQVPEFDFARTYEGWPSGGIVVSKRFYDFCKEHNLKCGFKPVRIDEE
ncbi:MAG: hypothetical protein SFY69_00885 [Planctomycetota bacterium]|nr:hypothetical protein [Planctomycetota bacterium]